jgi:FKBP-type peptidyl-prolyl cis-trans isomerase SlyD
MSIPVSTYLLKVKIWPAMSSSPMKISRNTVVTLNYRTTDPSGKVLDEGQEPLTYLHGGYGNLFIRLEEALEGKEIGQSIKVNLLPEDAFGLYEDALVLEEDRANFPEYIEIGMQFELTNAEGDEETLYRITAFDDRIVRLDGNPPLAGEALIFTCTVISMRPASAAEMKRKQALNTP